MTSTPVYILTLLRHAESEGNAANLIQGQHDLPLTDKGRQQARQLAERWKAQATTFDGIIASPLLRARQTAEIVAAALELPIEIDPAWQEQSFGEIEGCNIADFRQEHPEVDFYHPYFPVSAGGESQVDLFLRASQAVQTLIRRPAGNTLVVSHGSMLNMVHFAIMGITPGGHTNSPRFRFENTGYARWRYQPATRQWSLLSFVAPEGR